MHHNLWSINDHAPNYLVVDFIQVNKLKFQEQHWDELIDHIRSTYDFQSHEYCQYFAATLQMANEGKVIVSN